VEQTEANICSCVDLTWHSGSANNKHPGLLTIAVSRNLDAFERRCFVPQFNYSSPNQLVTPTIPWGADILPYIGLDNKTYYMLTPGGYYFNFSGTGNTLNCNNPIVRNMVLDCLRYWAAQAAGDRDRELEALAAAPRAGGPGRGGQPVAEVVAGVPPEPAQPRRIPLDRRLAGPGQGEEVAAPVEGEEAVLLEELHVLGVAQGQHRLDQAPHVADVGTAALRGLVAHRLHAQPQVLDFALSQAQFIAGPVKLGIAAGKPTCQVVQFQILGDQRGFRAPQCFLEIGT
jgi:hypothetical protein